MTSQIIPHDGRIDASDAHYFRDYLRQEHEDKRNEALPAEWTINYTADASATDKPHRFQAVPLQTNGFDCGMFVLRYAEYASRRAPINFGQADMNYFRQRTVVEICGGLLL